MYLNIIIRGSGGAGKEGKIRYSRTGGAPVWCALALSGDATQIKVGADIG